MRGGFRGKAGSCVGEEGGIPVQGACSRPGSPLNALCSRYQGRRRGQSTGGARGGAEASPRGGVRGNLECFCSSFNAKEGGRA